MYFESLFVQERNTSGSRKNKKIFCFIFLDWIACEITKILKKKVILKVKETAEIIEKEVDSFSGKKL